MKARGEGGYNNILEKRRIRVKNTVMESLLIVSWRRLKSMYKVANTVSLVKDLKLRLDLAIWKDRMETRAIHEFVHGEGKKMVIDWYK